MFVKMIRLLSFSDKDAYAKVVTIRADFDKLDDFGTNYVGGIQAGNTFMNYIGSLPHGKSRTAIRFEMPPQVKEIQSATLRVYVMGTCNTPSVQLYGTDTDDWAGDTNGFPHGSISIPLTGEEENHFESGSWKEFVVTDYVNDQLKRVQKEYVSFILEGHSSSDGHNEITIKSTNNANQRPELVLVS
ncbi:CBM96 family carbohydrate-binding protein [Paenibacillus timonensis]|uniref:CBM96 family carbohydrate-binding protein n=1 Tax=Paenibacillus timonensis TaxID=225915 RepID=UPI003F9E518F